MTLYTHTQKLTERRNYNFGHFICEITVITFRGTM